MMVSATAGCVLALTGNTLASWAYGESADWLGSPLMSRSTGYTNYTAVGGFFQQGEPATNATTYDYTANNYGLIKRPYDTDPEFDPKGEKTQWQRFQNYVNNLNKKAEPDTQYKVFFMARHGEGVHNAANDFYGDAAWNCYWSALDGNGSVIWADANLTSKGIKQTHRAHNFWRKALKKAKIPAPEAFYVSPLSRCLVTANLTFSGLDLGNGTNQAFTPTVMELLRETMTRETCNRRSNRTYIHELVPNFVIEPGLTERDELWRAGKGETDMANSFRSKTVLDEIFESSHDKTWISITSHSLQIKNMISVLGHPAYPLSTGQAISVLIKARKVKDVAPPAPPAVNWTTVETCKALPVELTTGGCDCRASIAPGGAHPPTSVPVSGAHELATLRRPGVLVGLIMALAVFGVMR